MDVKEFSRKSFDLRTKGLLSLTFLALLLTQAPKSAADATPATLPSRMSPFASDPETRPAMNAEADRAGRETAARFPFIRAVADENTALAIRLSEIIAKFKQTNDQMRVVTANAGETHRSYELTRQQLQIPGIGADMAEVLRQERSQLSDPQNDARREEELKRQINQARLARLRTDHQRQALPAIDQQISNLMAGKVDSSVSAAQRAQIEQWLRVLLTSRLGLLNNLIEGYDRYIDAATQLDSKQQELATESAAYARLLDERLLWIPNASVIGGTWLRELAASALWLGSPATWRDCAAALRDQTLGALPLVIVVVILFAALLIVRGRLRQRLERIAETVEKGYADQIWLTIRALLISLLLTLPWPMILLLAGSLLAGAARVGLFPASVGAGLRRDALVLFLLLFVRRLCRERGVADVHFHWPQTSRRVLHRNLAWLVTIALPVTFVVSMTQAYSNDAYTDGLGRLGFLVGSVALAVFAQRILRPKGGALEPLLARSEGGWTWRLRYFWCVLGVAIPLALAGAAMYGYYYAALAIEGRLFMSMLLIVGAIILHNLIVRWLTVAQRRVAMQQAKERREAALSAKATKQAADAAGEGAPQNLEVPQVDMATVNEHTRALLRFMIGSLVVVGLWAIWSSLVPALAIFKQVTLWQYSVSAGGQTQIVPITLASLGLAVLLLIVTFVAVKNLSGVLEIALLQRLSIDAGLRYAIARVSRYVIVAIGIVATFNAIGIGWSQVQWLVAAVGVGLGFGLQEIFANFVSGLIILFERPLRIGDFVTVGELSGTVSRIRMRATTLTDWDNKEIIVPNKTFITDRLVNWTLSDSTTRLIVKVGIAYGSDTALAQDLLMKAAASCPLVLPDPAPTVFFVNFGESSLDFELRVFVKEPNSRMSAVNGLHLAIDESFRKHGIEIPCPQRDLHLRTSDVPLFSQPEPALDANGA